MQSKVFLARCANNWYACLISFSGKYNFFCLIGLFRIEGHFPFVWPIRIFFRITVSNPSCHTFYKVISHFKSWILIKVRIDIMNKRLFSSRNSKIGLKIISQKFYFILGTEKLTDKFAEVAYHLSYEYVH